MTSQQQPPPIIPGTPPTTQVAAGPASYPVHPPVPKRRVHPLSIILAVVGVLALFIGIGIGASAGGQSAAPGSSPSVVYVTSPGAVAPIEAKPTTPPAPAPPAQPTIKEGSWTVGTDFPAGQYRTADAVAAECYWSITKSGSNGSDIIANDIPGGGRPTVTLKAGQDFTSHGCGTWAKVG